MYRVRQTLYSKLQGYVNLPPRPEAGSRKLGINFLPNTVLVTYDGHSLQLLRNMNSLTALISNRTCSNIPLVTCSEHSNNRYSPKYMYLPAIYEPSNRNRYNRAFAQSHKYGFLKQNHSNVGNQAQHRHHFPRQDSAKSVKWPYLTTSNCSWSWPRRCCCSCSPRTSCQRRRKRPPQC